MEKLSLTEVLLVRWTVTRLWETLFGCSCDNTMEVQLDLPSAHSANTLDETTRFVLGLSARDDFFEFGPRRNGKGRLLDRLVSGIQFGNNEVTRRPKS
jgi:hypothetical protein